MQIFRHKIAIVLTVASLAAVSLLLLSSDGAGGDIGSEVLSAEVAEQFTEDDQGEDSERGVLSATSEHSYVTTEQVEATEQAESETTSLSAELEEIDLSDWDDEELGSEFNL